MNFLGAGLGLVAPIVANKLGIGKNDTRAKTFDESKAYNQNAFQYGGRPAAADQTANRFANLGAGAQQRDASQANYGLANGYAQYGNQDRDAQNLAAHMMMARAQGLVPSISQMQADRQMQQATAAQSSASASARGAGGLALAGQNAANNTATMQSAISNQAQINAAQERMAAEQNAYGAYAGIRSSDLASQQQMAQQSQYNAGLMQQQRGMNDAYSLGMYGQEAGVRGQQLQGSMYQQGLLGNSQTNATNQNIAISQNNANREYEYYKQAMGGAQGGVNAATQLGTAAGPQPSVPSAPTAGGAAGASGAMSSSSVGVPQLGSDDRMKFGMSPLGLLGGGTSGQNPTSGPVGSEAYGAGKTSYEVLNGSGGENVGASGQAMSDFATQYGRDPTGGMQGGLLSDDRAKQKAYDLGYEDARRNESASASRDGVPQTMIRMGGADPPVAIDMTRDNPFVRLGQGVAPDLGAVDRDAQYYPPPRPQPAPAQPGLVGSMFDRDAQQAPPESIGRHYSSDPVTEQFAEGLAPIRFQYKPGMGPAGEQTGVRAQAAASQPVTASMIQKRPDGLMAIDPRMGLSTALAGVGHLSQKQKETDRKLDGLLAMTARREGY